MLGEKRSNELSLSAGEVSRGVTTIAGYSGLFFLAMRSADGMPVEV